MSSEGVSSRGPRTSNEVRSWSEDPLTARARSVWTSGDFLPIARSFAPGAQEFIERLKSSDRRFLVLTNNSIFTPRDLRARLLGSDIDVPEESIWTSALATAQFLAEQRPDGTAYVVGELLFGAPWNVHQLDCAIWQDRRSGGWFEPGEGLHRNGEILIERTREPGAVPLGDSAEGDPGEPLTRLPPRDRHENAAGGVTHRRRRGRR